MLWSLYTQIALREHIQVLAPQAVADMQQVQQLIAAADSVVALSSTPQYITDDTATVQSVVSVDSLATSAAEQTEVSSESVDTIYEGLLKVCTA
jgi:hypothetical protein